jgi:hypothetical protein
MLRLKQLDEVLLRAERTIALLDRCRARNHVAELDRLRRAWRAGRRLEPRFEYAPAPQLHATRAALEAALNRCQGAGPWGALYAARAVELDREAAVVEALGAAEFGARAAARFAVDDGPHGRQAELWARAWIDAPPDGSLGTDAVLSDDERDPRSLVSAMRRAVGRLRLPFRVILEKALGCAAATGDGVILVRAGAQYTSRTVMRVVVHEIEGHVLPRHRARAESCGLFAVAGAGGSDDEEGRALLLERRHGCFDVERRRELGRRHLAALSVRGGASWSETTAFLLELGTPADEAVEVASRAHRGGGLARELVYLPALFRVDAALTNDAELEPWLERGRIGVAAALSVRALGPPPEWLQPARAA